MGESTSTKQLVVTRILSAPPEKIWEAWTDPEKHKQWWSPKNASSPVAKMDLRVGGKYLWSIKPPGSPAVFTTGVFKEVVPNQRLVYTDQFADADGNVVDPSTYGFTGVDLPEALLVTVTFEPLPTPPDGAALTRLTIKHSTVPGDHGEWMEAGWHQMVDKLAQNVE